MSGGQVVASEGTLPSRALSVVACDHKQSLHHEGDQRVFPAWVDDELRPIIYISHIVVRAVPARLVMKLYINIWTLEATIP